jgi:CubicO group peptidase (beta-lactamase class C family)
MAANYRQMPPARPCRAWRRGAVPPRGLADVKTAPLTADAVFRSFVSKQFAAAGLPPAEAGKAALGDPLSKYARLPNGAHITVLELPIHTSRVKSYTGHRRVARGSDRKDQHRAADRRFRRQDRLPRRARAGPQQPGYALSAVIEAKRRRHDYLRTALFEPLGPPHSHGADPKAVARQCRAIRWI